MQSIHNLPATINSIIKTLKHMCKLQLILSDMLARIFYAVNRGLQLHCVMVQTGFRWLGIGHCDRLFKTL